MAEPKMSIDAVVLMRLGDNYNTPTWTELELARDVTITTGWDESEAFSRETVLKEFAKGLLGLEFTFSVKSAAGDAAYDAMMDSFADRKGVIDFCILDAGQTTNGAEGFRFDGGVFSAGNPQQLADVQYREFGVKPSAHRTNKAKLANVVNNAIVFTAIDT